MILRIGNQEFDMVTGGYGTVAFRYLNEGGKRYHWNGFMQYWEDSNYHFYRFATDQEIKDREKVTDMYWDRYRESRGDKEDDDYLPF